MAVNKNHPRYTEYIEKCKVLRDDLVRREDETQSDLYSGQDNSETFALHKDYLEKLKKLKKEYSFLFDRS